MTTFGEVILESSRAFPDDEEDDGAPQESITFERASEAEHILKDLESNKNSMTNLYIFHGKVACGFGSGFLSEDKFRFLGAVYHGGFDGTVDSLLSRQQRPVIKLYYGPNHIVFALVDTYGLPRSSANDVVQVISLIIEAAQNIIIFHSEPIVGFRGEGEVQGQLFHLRSSSIDPQASSIITATAVLPQPNIISGLSAAVLTLCEATKKPCVLLVTYCETELIDSISTKPFFDALQKGNTGRINIHQHFASLSYSSSRSTKSNFTPVRNSNLYT